MMAKGGAALAMAGCEDSIVAAVVVDDDASKIAPVVRVTVMGAFRKTWRMNSFREDSILAYGDGLVAPAWDDGRDVVQATMV